MAIGTNQAHELMQRSQGMVNQALERGTTLLADRVEHYTNVANELSDVLRERNESHAADLLGVLSGRTKDVAAYLRASDGASLWNDLQRYTEGREWTLAALGMLGGMAAARAIRGATSPRSRSTGVEGWETENYVDSYAQPYGASESEYDYERT